MERKTVRQVVLAVLDEKRSQIGDAFYQDTGLWQEVFRRVYGEEPKGDNDLRWDQLLFPSGHRGLQYVRLFVRLHPSQ